MMRIAKHIYDANDKLEKSTYYILDAQGKIKRELLKTQGRQTAERKSQGTISVYDREVNVSLASISYELKEQHIYGSSRLGVLNQELPMLASQNTTYSQAEWVHTIGKRTYEISNHLGNVLSVISDKPIPHVNGGTIDYYLADIRTSQDYSPFGVTLEGRDYSLAGAGNYRYGFGSMEKDDELKGAGNSYDFGARMYDPRVGRWLTIDPLARKYPGLSPYNYVGNSPLQHKDFDGRDYVVIVDKVNKTVTIKATYYVEIGDEISKTTAQEGVDFWNSISEKYTLKTKGENGKIDFKINFDLQVVETFNPEDCAAEISSVLREGVRIEGKEVYDMIRTNPDANSFSVLPTDEYNSKRIEEGGNSSTSALGFVSKGRYLYIDIAEINSDQVSPHEIGHTLGLDHWNNTLMNPGSDGSMNLRASMIATILGNAGLVKNYEEDGAGGGLGTSINAEGEKMTQDSKEEIKNKAYVKQNSN